MGIFSGLFKSRDKPQNRTSGSNYAFFFGGSTSGKAVTERSAMQMTAVYSCVRILSEAVAGLPLHLYKYTGQSVLSEVFGRELIKHKGRQIAAWQPDVVMAVPLHRRRLWFRGYNQAEKLAGYVAQALKIPVMESGLIRLKNTRPQNQLNDKQRRHNLSDVFEVPASAMTQIQGKRILLMDDIYTTGSTLEACGSALRQAGAEDIYFACLCIGSEESI